jgi:hypothetical protein
MLSQGESQRRGLEGLARWPRVEPSRAGFWQDGCEPGLRGVRRIAVSPAPPHRGGISVFLLDEIAVVIPSRRRDGRFQHRAPGSDAPAKNYVVVQRRLRAQLSTDRGYVDPVHTFGRL